MLRPKAQRLAIARMQGVAARHVGACRAELETQRHSDAVEAAAAEIRGVVDDEHLDRALLQELLDEAAAAKRP